MISHSVCLSLPRDVLTSPKQSLSFKVVFGCYESLTKFSGKSSSSFLKNLRLKAKTDPFQAVSVSFGSVTKELLFQVGVSTGVLIRYSATQFLIKQCCQNLKIHQKNTALLHNLARNNLELMSDEYERQPRILLDI